jgi:NitT/TauT family transport system substrate-binding protein
VKIRLQQAALAFVALAMISGFQPSQAQSKITIAVGGGACLCYLPTVLAKQLGEYEKAGPAVEVSIGAPDRLPF